MKNIHILKVGQHVAMNGRKIEFTEADLQAIADSYDPSLHEAPLVVGHPKADAPAYGWAKGLSFADGDLFAEPNQVNPEFAEMVAGGSFKKRSASLYPPNSPNNPTPGNYYLKHIGFLGAQPPAIKGLQDVSFAEDEGLVTIELSEWTDRTVARMFRKLKNFLIDKFGKEEADKVIDEWEIEDITSEALTPDAPAEPAFSEPPTKENEMTAEELKQQQEKLEAEKAEFAEQQKDFKQQQETLKSKQVETAKAEHIAFCEDLAKQGKLLPAHQAFAVEFMAALSDETTIEFGEGDDKQTPTQLEGFKSFLGSMPNLVEFAEVAKNKDTPPESDNGDANDIARRAVEFQEAEEKAGRTISTADAVTHVLKEK